MKIHPEAKVGTLRIGQREVTYHDTGNPVDDRQAVVLVHGTGGSASTHFRTVFPMLAARHRVIAVDWGHHAEPAGGETDLTLSDLADQVAAVIEHRSPNKPVHLVGYSLGAVVSASIAGERPDLVDTLTLIAGWVTSDLQQKLRYRLWNRLVELEDKRVLQEFSTFTAFSAQFLRGKTWPELEALITSRVVRDGTRAETALNATIDISEHASRISAPTLIIGCTEDQMVPFRHSLLLFGAITDARLARVESGHAVTSERPAQVFKLIDDFVGSPASVPAGESVPALTI